MHKKHLFIAGVFAAAILLTNSFLNNNNKTESKSANTTVQNNMMRPEFSLPDLEGKLRNINEWDGKYIVLNFWATWCPPCRKEIPEFIELQRQYSTSNLQFIGVAIDNAVSVNQFAMEMGINYPNLIADMQGIDLARQYGNSLGALPYSVIINPNGEIIFRQTGLLSREKVLDVTQLLKD